MLGAARRQVLARGKVIGKTLGVDGGRGHDDFQVGAARQYLAQVAQQKINIQAALVRLVDDDGVVGFKQRVGLCLGQQNAVSHQLDRGIAAEPILKPHLEAHHIAQRGFKFFSNALGHAAGCNAARLRVAYEFGMLARRVIQFAASHGQRDLW